MTKEELAGIVSKNLIRFREENHLTQEEVVELVGISTSFYANLERGKKSMSLLVLRKIADALNISTDYLLYENRADIRIRNIELLLRKQSHNFAATVEQMVRVLINGFSGDS